MGWFRRQIPQLGETLWSELTRDYPFLKQFDNAQQQHLRSLASQFLATKQFSGAHGFIIDDYVGAAIAVQACLPILHLGLASYDDFTQLIIYPDQFRIRSEETDELGIVHQIDDVLSGQAIDEGPVVLSWPDASASGISAGYNVVIHEFIHKLDLRDGVADGVPPLPRAQRGEWIAVLQTAYETFADWVTNLESSLPGDIDPESEAAQPYFASLPLDPYAAHDPAEFFAVCGEAVFTDPQPLAQSFPPFDRMLRQWLGLPAFELKT
jgi:MtfA peptidase